MCIRHSLIEDGVQGINLGRPHYRTIIQRRKDFVGHIDHPVTSHKFIHDIFLAYLHLITGLIFDVPETARQRRQERILLVVGHKVCGDIVGHLVPRTESFKKVASLTRWRKEPVHRLIGRYEHTAHVRLIAGLARVSAFRLVQVPSRIEIQQARRIRTVIFRKGVCRTLIEITCLEDGVALGIPFVEHRTGETVHQSAETAHLFIPPDISRHVFGRNQHVGQLVQIPVLANDIFLDNLIGKQRRIVCLAGNTRHETEIIIRNVLPGHYIGKELYQCPFRGIGQQFYRFARPAVGSEVFAVRQILRVDYRNRVFHLEIGRPAESHLPPVAQRQTFQELGIRYRSQLEQHHLERIRQILITAIPHFVRLEKTFERSIVRKEQRIAPRHLHGIGVSAVINQADIIRAVPPA